MMLITLQGPQACGKTLTHKLLKKHIQKIEQKTGHTIVIREILSDDLHANTLNTLIPSFWVMRFKASGKWVDSFCLSVLRATSMQHVSDLLRTAKTMPKGGSIVVVNPLTEAAERFFYPIEVKDES